MSWAHEQETLLEIDRGMWPRQQMSRSPTLSSSYSRITLDFEKEWHKLVLTDFKKSAQFHAIIWYKTSTTTTTVTDEYAFTRLFGAKSPQLWEYGFEP